MTVEPYCYADMIPTAEAIERLRSSMWRTLPVTEKVAEARRDPFIKAHIAVRFRLGLHTAKSADILYEAVVASRLALYAWPTQGYGVGVRQPDEQSDTLRVIPLALIERLRPLHRGLPSSFVGGRQPILKHFAGIAATDVPVFVRTEFERWLKDERHKGSWATQRPLDAEDKRARMPRQPGRPSIQDEVEQAIQVIIADGKWTRGDPVSGLHRLVRAERCKANEDTVRKALDDLHIRTGDSRYRGRFFERRNPWSFQR